jgi:hypothetical protein
MRHMRTRNEVSPMTPFFLLSASDRIDALSDAVVAAYKSIDLIELTADIDREINRSLEVISQCRVSGELADLYRERDVLREWIEMRTAASILLAAAVHDAAVAADALEKARALAIPYSERA